MAPSPASPAEGSAVEQLRSEVAALRSENADVIAQLQALRADMAKRNGASGASSSTGEGTGDHTKSISTLPQEERSKVAALRSENADTIAQLPALTAEGAKRDGASGASSTGDGNAADKGTGDHKSIPTPPQVELTLPVTLSPPEKHSDELPPEDLEVAAHMVQVRTSKSWFGTTGISGKNSGSEFVLGMLTNKKDVIDHHITELNPSYNDDGIVHQIELKNSLWDASSILFTKSVGGANSCFICFLLTFNIAVQIQFVRILINPEGGLSEPKFDDEKILAFQTWRRGVGHDYTSYSPFLKQTLASRVCAEDSGLEAATEQLLAYSTRAPKQTSPLETRLATLSRIP